MVRAFVATPAHAQAQDDHAAARTINGTTFVLPALADSAFVLTEFGFRQGINYQQIPDFPVSSLVRLNLSWVQFEERVDLGLRLTPWLGLYAEGVGSAALGPDTGSLLFEGGGLDFGGKGGVVVRVYRNDRTRSQVAVRAYAGGDEGRTLDIPDFLEAFGVRAANDLSGPVQSATSAKQLAAEIQNGAFALAETNYSNIVFYRTSTVRAGISVHYAQALIGPLTLQVSANLERSRSRQTPYRPVTQEFETLSSTNTAVTFDAVVSASLNRWLIPIGLSAEYASLTTAISVDQAGTHDATTQFVGAGIWYTGRRGVEIGALAFTQRDLQPVHGYGTTEVSGKPVGYSGSLVFRALW